MLQLLIIIRLLVKSRNATTFTLLTTRFTSHSLKEGLKWRVEHAYFFRLRNYELFLPYEPDTAENNPDHLNRALCLDGTPDALKKVLARSVKTTPYCHFQSDSTKPTSSGCYRIYTDPNVSQTFGSSYKQQNQTFGM